MPDTNRAAEWLIAEFDVTDPDDIETYEHCEITRGYEFTGQVRVQPMYTLKSVMSPCATMRVTRTDYNDPLRWWL